jgi:hypothetical protein
VLHGLPDTGFVVNANAFEEPPRAVRINYENGYFSTFKDVNQRLVPERQNRYTIHPALDHLTSRCPK